MPRQPDLFIFKLLCDSCFEKLVLRFIQIYLLFCVGCLDVCVGEYFHEKGFSESFSEFLLPNSQRGYAALQISDAAVSEENQRHSQQKRASQKSVLFIYLDGKLQWRNTRSGLRAHSIYMYCCRICFDFTCFDKMHHSKSPRELLQDTAVIF